MNADKEKYSAKVPLRLKCHNCNEPFTHKVHLDQSSFDWTCPKCGFKHPSFLGLDITVGVLLLEKSRYELVHEKDFSMAVVFAAMAFESELSRLFLKWKEIECIGAGVELDREECERGLRDFKAIDRKIEGVSQFLVKSGIDDFVSSKAQLRDQIATSFKTIRIGTLAADFQRHLFWPRNKVIHWGDAKNSYDDAARCYSFAKLGLIILREMDLDRLRTLSVQGCQLTCDTSLQGAVKVSAESASHFVWSEPWNVVG